VIGTLARAVWFTAIYLMVLTSAAPGDIVIGAVLGLTTAFALRPRGPHAHAGAPAARARATVGMLLQTAAEVVRGTWRTARFCLGAPSEPALVEIPRGDRSADNVALWGVLTGEAPDEYPVDTDADRGVLIVHVLDGANPHAVRERHRVTYERWQRRVAP